MEIIDLNYQYLYQDYLADQIQINQRKIRNMKPGHSWVKPIELSMLASRIKYYGLARGVCHGARTGAEVRTLRGLTGAYIFGTDISPTAKNYEFMIMADMNQVKPAWRNYFDFVYSNSFDHAFDPAVTIEAWKAQLKPGGFLFLHWSEEHAKVNKINRVGGSMQKLLEFMNDRMYYSAFIEPIPGRKILTFKK